MRMFCSFAILNILSFPFIVLVNEEAAKTVLTELTNRYKFTITQRLFFCYDFNYTALAPRCNVNLASIESFAENKRPFSFLLFSIVLFDLFEHWVSFCATSYVLLWVDLKFHNGVFSIEYVKQYFWPCITIRNRKKAIASFRCTSEIAKINWNTSFSFNNEDFRLNVTFL